MDPGYALSSYNELLYIYGDLLEVLIIHTDFFNTISLKKNYLVSLNKLI